MTPEQTAFYHTVVQPLEAQLLGLELAKLFSGDLYDMQDDPLGPVSLPDFGDHGLLLSPTQVGRLFMAPDESNVDIAALAEQEDGTPAGVHAQSFTDFARPETVIDVCAYKDVIGAGVRIDALYLKTIMLRSDAPERLCTVAFALQACTAFQLGFAEVTGYAAGKGRGDADPDEEEDDEEDDLVGYQVWPKFGFDAPVQPVEFRGDHRFAQCRSVQDVQEIDPAWWEANGGAREMRFDLAPNSRSWQVLVNYLHNAFFEEWYE
ncbi:hypothetical protein [Pseudoduganella sp. R-34]|uniref:hypothetical protein n=1 Tax=Pseudoduganella sp. R-34 TaxID=3404062 RepID=UPI003CF2CC73